MTLGTAPMIVLGRRSRQRVSRIGGRTRSPKQRLQAIFFPERPCRWLASQATPSGNQITEFLDSTPRLRDSADLAMSADVRWRAVRCCRVRQLSASPDADHANRRHTSPATRTHPHHRCAPLRGCSPPFKMSTPSSTMRSRCLSRTRAESRWWECLAAASCLSPTLRRVERGPVCGRSSTSLAAGWHKPRTSAQLTLIG
jgi:hypothetical protein